LFQPGATTPAERAMRIVEDEQSFHHSFLPARGDLGVFQITGGFTNA
jgi:hypothetical protein